MNVDIFDVYPAINIAIGIGRCGGGHGGVEDELVIVIDHAVAV